MLLSNDDVFIPRLEKREFAEGLGDGDKGGKCEDEGPEDLEDQQVGDGVDRTSRGTGRRMEKVKGAKARDEEDGGGGEVDHQEIGGVDGALIFEEGEEGGREEGDGG